MSKRDNISKCARCRRHSFPLLVTKDERGYPVLVCSPCKEIINNPKPKQNG